MFLESLIKSDESGLLTKVFKQYSGFLVKREFKTHANAPVGANCLKTIFFYEGIKEIGYYKEVDIWTQEMQDALTDTALNNALSLSFDGVNEYVNFGNNFNYDISTAFSFSLWIKPNNVSAQRCILGKATDDANVYGYTLYHSSTGALIIQLRSPAQLRVWTFDLVLVGSAWQHLVFTYNGGANISGARVWVNNVQSNTPTTGTFTNSWLAGQNFTLGSRNTTQHFSGLMDEITVFNTDLNSSQISELYNSGIPGNPEDLSFAGNLVSYYNFEEDANPSIFDNVGVTNGTMVNMDNNNFVNDVA